MVKKILKYIFSRLLLAIWPLFEYFYRYLLSALPQKAPSRGGIGLRFIP